MSEREPWVIDVAQALERRIAASGARPDFLDVVERAHALDPKVVPAEALALADELMAAEDQPVERGPAREEAAVDAWLHDVRAAVERRVDERREQAPPALRGSRSRRGVWWVAGAAVAAAALLLLGLGQVVRMVAEPETPAEQALMGGRADGTEPLETVERAREGVSREHAREPKPEAVEPDEPEEVVAPVEPEASALEPETSEAEPPTTAARSGRDRWKALADEAQAHWRAGRRDEAQRLFAKIAAGAGRTRAAELAYSDLFTLASQAGDAAAQRRWWKDYLRRFPRGRFADDARAGLCRGAAAGERAACWQTYLDDFPQGSFRGEARGALGQGAR